MILQIFTAIIVGILAGIITGLTPGIHINLLSLLLLSAAPFLLAYTGLVSLAVFIISMSVTHTFLDALPSIFLGAPEAATALGVLPGHRFLLKGRGYDAVKLTVIGSFGALLLSILTFPILIPIVKQGYPLIKDYIAYFLIGVLVFMIGRDKKRVWAVVIFLLSGVLGLIVLNAPNLKNPLFPLLSGLFGTSTLIYSLSKNDHLPKQKIRRNLTIKKNRIVKALLSGQFSGFITAVFPGLGAAQAAVISMQITRDLRDNGFMILIGSISTFNFVLSMVTLYVIGKARNGAIITVQKLVEVQGIHIIIFLLAALIAGSISVFLALRIGKVFVKLINKVNYKKLAISIIMFVAVMVLFLTGPVGLFVLFVSTCIGLIPAVVKVTRTHAMGCLLLPVILFFVL
ncbi:hypothetical protein D6745_02765 [Candidatus Woesearchaeota archaeon]|nr:MAG: hypothetical protein D6745_02765 [Candidatus Woesearchaeota archaeon]